jgi:hypothetical protein
VSPVWLSPVASLQFEAIRKYIESGGSVLIMSGEGGEARFGTNINYLLEEFGIAVNNDAVVRTVFHKYLHPKEVFIGNGVLNKGIVDAIHKSNRKDPRAYGLWLRCLRGMEGRLLIPGLLVVCVCSPTTSNEASEAKAR